ncbi:NAD-dependent succinate-semialdehyde dehydrogenase [Pseudorhodoferax sp.]|uniref:NAD-dependent succinate-semialdehyde dehydrogenase n=1 Tax=Pseudorhodoferax sp. TaxID=1993553 RepID=UPI002DD63818|nr:NAD-dependent succinate-semialdehyde dehydrogenase [Pseudorhodoferax sp.]
MPPSLVLNDPQLLRQQARIGDAWCGADDGQHFAVHDPASGALLAHVPQMGAAETERAITAAEQALPAWKRLDAGARGALLHRWNALVLQHTDDLAQLLTAEQGKPLADARAEVGYAASFIAWYAEEARRTYGDVIPGPAGDRRILALKEPVGVCAAITPWNFPYAMVTRKAAAALAAGCTLVLKPAEQTPLCALALMELALRAGIPSGVLNVVTGDPVAIGGALTASPRVRKISFTGSTEVGRLLMRQSAPTLKKLSLELGGNAPFIVFEDADLDAAVEGLLTAKFRNAGQACIAANRIYVHERVYEDFAARLARAASALQVGPGTAPGAQIGPLIDAAALAKVERHVADARAHGARVLAGGERHALGGTYYSPTVLADADERMLLAREETFGPVAPLFRFAHEHEAIAAANSLEFGLGAYLYSRDHARIWRCIEALETGMVGINSGLISTAVAPFGGIKQSGFGREGARHGIDEYLVVKYVCLGGLG